MRLSGQGSALTPIQNQVDVLVGGFVDQATDGRSLAAMVAGGMACRLGRIGAMTAGVGSFLSIGIGLGAEVTAFEMTNRSLVSLAGENHSNPQLWRWDGQGGIRQGLLSSLITFGSLKGAGRLIQGQNFLVQHLVQDGAMVVGHNASAVLGLTPRPMGSLAEQFLHAEATNLQLGAGLALGHTLTGGGIHALERGLDFALRDTEMSSFSLAKDRTFLNLQLMSGLMVLNSGCDSQQGIADPTDRLILTGIIMGGAYGAYRILRRWIQHKVEERYHGPRPGEAQLDHLRVLHHPREMKYNRTILGEIGQEVEISPPTKPTNPPKIFDLFLDPRSGKVVESYELISPQPYAPPPEPNHPGLIHARIGIRIDIHQFADLLKSPVLSLPLLKNLHDRSRDYEIAFHSEDIFSNGASFPWAKGEWIRLLEKPPIDSDHRLPAAKDPLLRPGDRIERAGLSFRWLPPRKGSRVQEYAWTLLVPKIEDLREEWMDPDLELEQRKKAFQIYISLLRQVSEHGADFLDQERRILGEVWRSLPEGMGALFFGALNVINNKLFPEEAEAGAEDESLILHGLPELNSFGTEESGIPPSGVRDVEQIGRWAEVLRLNERILEGDMEAIRQGRVYYAFADEDESVSGNARLPNHIAVNTYVDPDSGQIVAVGNPQYLPPEAYKGKVEATFRVKVLPEDFADPQRKDFTPTITDGRIVRPVRPEVRAVLESLIGKPFFSAREDYFPDSDSGGSEHCGMILAFLMDHHGSLLNALLNQGDGSLHYHRSDMTDLMGTPLLAAILIATAFTPKNRPQAPLSLPEIKTEILQVGPLPAGRARFLMGQIVSPDNEEPTLEKYQALLQLSQRSDFQDFPPLFRALDQLGKQGRPIDFNPIVESLWVLLGTSSGDVQNRLTYLKEQERLQTLISKKHPKGFAAWPLYNAIQMSEGPLELRDLMEKMSRPAVAHRILRMEIYRTLADDPRLKSPATHRKILRELKETGRLFHEAKFFSMELGSALTSLVHNPHFSGKRNIQDAIDLLPLAVGPGTGLGPVEGIMARLFRLQDFRFRDHERRILRFVQTGLMDPSDRIFLLGRLGLHPKVGELSLQRILQELLRYEPAVPPHPHLAKYERYVQITQQFVGALGQIGMNPNFVQFPFLIHKIRAAKIFPLVRAGALSLILSNPNLREAQDFRDIIDEIFTVGKNQEALETFLKICVGNRRLPEEVRDELWGRLGMEDPRLLRNLVLFHQSLGVMN